MIEFRKTKFIKSCPSVKDAPGDKLKEIVFIGKSNVGKSSLINAICENKNLAFTSSKPGHTRLLNYYNVNNQCYLVDAPGFGYSAAGQKHTVNFGEMMEEYFSDNKQLKLVCYLLDSRRVPSEDEIEFFQFIKENNLPYILVITKCDKLNQSEKSKIFKNINSSLEGVNQSNIVLSSINDANSLLNLRKIIASKL